jgi:Rieske Fe-S protein
MHDTNDEAAPSRRSVLSGTATGAISFAMLAACSQGSGESGGGYGGSGGSEGSGNGSGGGSQGGQPLAKTSQIPQGGGTVFKDEKVVVTQPSAGDFKAFSATCTHRGCTVDTVEGGRIKCPCHGSQFNAETGEVEAGPATEPLPAVDISVNGNSIVKA